MRDVAELLVSRALSLFACFFLVVRDENRLPPERVGEAWPAVTRNVALVAFGQLGVLVHFARTRWADGIVRTFGISLGMETLATLPGLGVSLALADDRAGALEEAAVLLVLQLALSFAILGIWAAVRAIRHATAA
jgi:hypothetical protein